MVSKETEEAKALREDPLGMIIILLIPLDIRD
jgi:hypothetical protein